MTMRVVIADDHPIFLDGLKILIDAQSDLEVIAAVESGERAIEAVKEQQPEILISDISMRGISGIEAAREVRSLNASIKILMLSIYADRGHVLAALNAGANGYLLKDSACDELVNAVRVLASDKAYLSPAIAHHVVTAVNGGASDKDGVSRLTKRELEVLRMIVDGGSTKMIARKLSLSAKTISTHRENLMQKLNIHSVAELTRFALREGLVLDD